MSAPSPLPGTALHQRFAAPLDTARLAAALGDRCDLRTVRTTGSTNADVLAEVRRAAPPRPQLLAAVEQTAGRGRLGRRWSTAPGSALLFSLAVPTRAPPEGVAAASLACAVALAAALRAEGIPLAIKWPNDLLLDERKLAGTLIELAIDADGARTLVVGVGLNLWCDAAQRAQIGQPAAALAERIALPDLAAERELRLARLAGALLDALALFEAQGFVPLHARYMQWLAWVGAEVELSQRQTRVGRGRLCGVDAAGRLLVEVEGRPRAFVVGDLSLRSVGPAAV